MIALLMAVLGALFFGVSVYAICKFLIWWLGLK